MPRAPLAPLLAAVLAAALLAAGCGGAGPSADRPEPRSEPRPAPPAERDDPRPGDVPGAPAGSAPRGAEPVIRAWLAAVRRADFDRAAALFAPGARVQNGGPVQRLATREQARRWNAALPCGAVLTKLGGAHGFAVVTFRLVPRPGADCAGGTGAPAYGAIRVRDGRITDWIRLPEPIGPPRGDAPERPFV